MVSQVGGMSSSSSTRHSRSLPTAPFPARWVMAAKALKLLICQVGKEKRLLEFGRHKQASSNTLRKLTGCHNTKYLLKIVSAFKRSLCI